MVSLSKFSNTVLELKIPSWETGKRKQKEYNRTSSKKKSQSNSLRMTSGTNHEFNRQILRDTHCNGQQRRNRLHVVSLWKGLLIIYKYFETHCLHKNLSQWHNFFVPRKKKKT